MSRTIGADHVVDEIVLRCTHDREVPALLPGVPPTGKLIELPHVVLMRFEDGRVAHEHIYWDQASLLAQVGLIDTAGLPVMGAEQANGLLARLRSAPAAAGRPRPELGAVFDAHVAHKFVDKNVHLTMTTMTADPYVYNVPTGVGGDGRAGVERFYREMLVGVMPADTAILPISRTVGADRVVDELVLSFTHDVPIGFMLPGIAPTGRSVALPYVVVMGFDRDQVAHEHIYWDQGSLLVQVGLLDPGAYQPSGPSPLLGSWTVRSR